jgi:integrase
MAWTRELKTRWQIRFSDADRTPTETTNSVSKAEYPTKTAADKEADRRQVLYDQGEYDPWRQDHPGVRANPDRLTLLEAVRRYVGAKEAAGQRGEKGGWSPGTTRRYRATLSKFARDVGPNLPIRQLRTKQIRDWTTRPALSDASKRTYHGIVRAFVHWLCEKGLADPEMPPAQQTRQTIPSYCTREELRHLCKAWPTLAVHRAAQNDSPSASATWWYPDAWRFAYWQALRKSEITALRCGAIDLGRGKMRVGDEAFVPKGKDETVIPLAEPAAKIAGSWNVSDRPAEERLFRHKAADYVSKAFTAARRHVFPEKDLTLHSLRHGRCVQLLEEGLSLHVVKRFMRHKSLDATMRYVQVADQSLQDEIRGLDEGL